MKGAALSVFFCLSVQAQPGAVEGLAVNGVSGEPLAGVHIRIFSGGYETIGSAYGAMSDSAGHFSMAQVTSGTYFVTAERTGFVFVRKTPTLFLKSGERLANLKVDLVPRSIVAGRIVDENGDPVAQVPVTLEPISRESSYGMGTFSGMVTSDDRGEFRLRAGPGKYRVRATPRDMYMTLEPQVRTDGTPQPVYGPTYFPNTANREQASIVETAPGGEVSGIEIRLARSVGLNISGVVTGMPENAMATVMLQSGDSSRHITRSRGLGLQRDGKFNFGRMEPGFYRVFATYTTGKVSLQSAPLEFKLEGADVTNLQLALAPGGEITGTLEFAGGGVSLETRTVRLKQDVQFGGKAPSAQVDKQGAFRIASVPPDRLRVQVDPLPDNAYIKTVHLDGSPIVGAQIDFSGGARDAKLKITVGMNGGQITGRVVEKDGQPLTSPVATVYLLQDPESRQPDPVRMAPDGNYSIKSIRPGKYRLLAIDPLRSRPDEGGDLLKELFAKAEEIEIKEGDRISKDLKVTVSEDSHAQ